MADATPCIAREGVASRAIYHDAPIRQILPLRQNEQPDESLIAAFSVTGTPSSLRRKLESLVSTDDWSSLCAYRTGLETPAGFEAQAVTVVFGVQEEAAVLERPQELIDAAREILSRHDANLREVVVEVVPGTTRLLTGGLPSGHPLRPNFLKIDYESAYERPLAMGSSIRGAEPGSAQGSSGCFLRIKIKGNTYNTMLTAHHVVSGTPGEILYGRRMPKVVSPSTPDHDGLAKWLGYIQDGQLPRVTAEVRETATVQKAAIDAFDREAGSLLYSSGLRTGARGYILDYALVELDEKRIPHGVTNIPSPRTIEAYHAEVPEDLYYDCGRLLSMDRPATVSPSLAHLESTVRPPDLVYKRGRTTGHTVGFWNGIHASVRISYSCRDPETGEEAQKVVEGMAAVVGNVHPGPRPFATLGDSGASVVNAHNGLIGTITSHHAQVPSTPLSVINGVTYVTPMPIILEDAKMRLEQMFDGPVEITVL